MAEPSTAEAVPTSVIFDFIDKTAKAYGVDPDFAKKILLSENMGKNGNIPASIPIDRVSSKDARGLMQVIPATHEGLKRQGYLPEDHTLDKWQDQIIAGLAAIQAKQKEQKTTDPRTIAVAYNGGTEAVKNYKAGNFNALPNETVDYLTKLETANRALNSTGSGARPSASQADVRKSDMGLADGGGDTVTVPTGGTSNTAGIEAIIETVRKNGLVFDNLVSDITKSTVDAAAAKGREAAALVLSGKAAGEAAEAEGVVDASNLRMKERILGILGLDTREVDNVVAKSMVERQELAGKRKQVAASIDEKMSVGFFDNPIQWLINQTILPGEVATHNALARQERDNITNVDNLQAQAAAQDRIDIGATVDDIARRQSAIANSKVAKANAEAEAARAQSSALGAQAAMQIGSLRGRQLDDEVRVAQFMEVLNDRRELNLKKQADRDKEIDVDNSIKRLGAAVGRPGMNLATLRRESKPVQEAWIARATSGNFGDSFAESAIFLGKEGNLKGMAEGGKAEFAQMVKAHQQIIIDKSDQLRNEWPTTHPGIKVPSIEEARKIVAEGLETEFSTAVRTNMLTASSYNPYKIDHAKEAIAYKGDPSNLIFQAVKNAYENKQQVNDRIILDYVGTLVDTQTVTPAQAAALLKEYYADGVKRNNIDRSIPLMGLDTQTGYSVKLPGVPKSVDLLNSTNVENALTLKATQSYIQRNMNPEGFTYDLSGPPVSEKPEGGTARKPYKFGAPAPAEAK